PLVRGVESHELAALLAAAEPGPALFAAETPADTSSIASVCLNEPEVPPSLSWPGGTTTIAAPPTQTAVSERSEAASLDQLTHGAASLIVIEDPPDHAVPSPNAMPPPVRRKEYRQLFAQLRRG